MDKKYLMFFCLVLLKFNARVVFIHDRFREVPGVVDWSLPIVLLKCSETLDVKATLQSEGK